MGARSPAQCPAACLWHGRGCVAPTQTLPGRAGVAGGRGGHPSVLSVSVSGHLLLLVGQRLQVPT